MGRTAPIATKENAMRKLLIGAALSAIAFTTPTYANISVFACEPEWGALATELGGDKVSVFG
jgi:zinc/manganese transport system substrate-binding protein